jgi:hypothetical protein
MYTYYDEYPTQRLSKHITAKAKERNNRMSIVRQRISKHDSLKIEAVFSAWSMQSDCTEVFSSRVQCRDASLSEYEVSSRGIKINWQLRNNGKK